ncbi:AzlD domain-containing protein [Treponema sp. HNW]|uniref:branched-chain amino acid transporter permease n=1 Tax=Treponema sp. HNW TaxID=3116654 RepID=UPI003D0D27EA
MLGLRDVFIAVPLMGIIIFSTRLFSFVLFSKREAPPPFRYLGKHLPPLVMIILIIYTLKDIDFSNKASYIPAAVSLTFTLIAHIYKGNALISIFGGTILYMLLI